MRAVLSGLLVLLTVMGRADAQVLRSPDERAARLVRQMTLDEKIQFVHTRVGARDPHDPPPRDKGAEPARVSIPHSRPRKIERVRWSRVASLNAVRAKG